MSLFATLKEVPTQQPIRWTTTIHKDRGVLIDAPNGLPPSLLLEITKPFVEMGYNQFCSAVSRHYNVMMALTNTDCAKLWCAEIDAKAERHHSNDLAMKWYNSCHTGMSSECMWSVFTGRNPRDLWPQVSLPHDNGDFGRCVGLLDAVPEYRARLHEVSDKHPEWLDIIDNWKDLEAKWRAEESIHEMLKELIQCSRDKIKSDDESQDS